MLGRGYALVSMATLVAWTATAVMALMHHPPLEIGFG